MHYLYLAGAILAEVIATSSLKATQGFTRPVPTAVMGIGYLVSFYLLSVIVQRIDTGAAYAIWSGAGIVLVTLVAAVIYKQVPDTAAVVGTALILTGVLVMHLFSKSVAHY